MKKQSAHTENTENTDLISRWNSARAAWLETAKSPATRRSYAASVTQWQTFLTVPLWAVSVSDVAGWIARMKADRLSVASINARLSGCTSFYAYAVQHGLIENNPFRSEIINRPKVSAYANAEVISTPAIRGMIVRLANHENKTPTDWRDYALLSVAATTGYKLSKILALTTDDLTSLENKSPKLYAIVRGYLKADRRLETMQPGDYIWRPMQHRGGRLLNGKKLTEIAGENRHITQSSATEVLRKHLRRYYFDVNRAEMGVTAAKEEARRKAQNFSFAAIRNSITFAMLDHTDDPRVLGQALGIKTSTAKVAMKKLEEHFVDPADLLAKHFGI